MYLFNAEGVTRIVRNREGNLQVIDSAVFEAAGLDPNTVTHGCTDAGVKWCAAIATVVGEGEDWNTRNMEMMRQSVELLGAATDEHVLKIWWFKLLEGVATSYVRFQNNLEGCRETCGKRSWQR